VLAHGHAGSRELRRVSALDADGVGFERYATGRRLGPVVPGAGEPATFTSGWRTAAFSIDPRDELDIEFMINDTGDGIMDSVVLVGRVTTTNTLVPGFFESAGRGSCVPADDYCNLLHPPYPEPATPQEFPPPVCDVSGVVTRGSLQSLRGAIERGGITQPGGVADGATRFPVVIGRTLTEGPFDEVEVTLLDAEAPLDGGLGQFGSFDRLQTVTVPAVELEPDFWAAGAQFFTPDAYWHDGLSEGDHGLFRTVEIEFCFQRTAGGELCVTNAGLPTFIYRPSVVLMHGLWSGKDIWRSRDGLASVVAPSDSPLLGLDELSVVDADYSNSNARSFEDNQFVPDQALRQACETIRGFSSFGARHDYVGHSMGGNLARV
jgi:hypothetical protein